MDVYFAKLKSLESGKNPEFDAYFERKCTKAFMESELAQHLVSPVYLALRVPPTKATCSQEQKRLFHDFRKTQAESRATQKSALALRERLVKNLFDKVPTLSPLKDRYQKIKACENGSLK